MVETGADNVLGKKFKKEEIEAARAYGADATFFHLIAQGISEHLSDNPNFYSFSAKAKQYCKHLDAAISKSSLRKSTVLYSGHGRGIGIRGALFGDAIHFVGLRYKYRGYISTSASREIAIRSFLAKRVSDGSLPTLLKIELPTGFPALDMNEIGMQGEGEFLLGRQIEFDIVCAATIHDEVPEGEVLELHLVPRLT